MLSGAQTRRINVWPPKGPPGPKAAAGYIRLRSQRLPDPRSNLAGLGGDAISLRFGSYVLVVRLNHSLKTSSPTGTCNAETQEWQRIGLGAPSVAKKYLGQH